MLLLFVILRHKTKTDKKRNGNSFNFENVTKQKTTVWAKFPTRQEASTLHHEREERGNQAGRRREVFSRSRRAPCWSTPKLRDPLDCSKRRHPRRRWQGHDFASRAHGWAWRNWGFRAQWVPEAQGKRASHHLPDTHRPRSSTWPVLPQKLGSI